MMLNKIFQELCKLLAHLRITSFYFTALSASCTKALGLYHGDVVPAHPAVCSVVGNMHARHAAIRAHAHRPLAAELKPSSNLLPLQTPHQHQTNTGLVAQLAEYRFPTPVIVGSSPTKVRLSFLTFDLS